MCGRIASLTLLVLVELVLLGLNKKVRAMPKVARISRSTANILSNLHTLATCTACYWRGVLILKRVAKKC